MRSASIGSPRSSWCRRSWICSGARSNAKSRSAAGRTSSTSLGVPTGAFLPPALQQAWEDLGVIVLQGYGATETGTGACTTLDDHKFGTVGRAPEGVSLRIAEDGEVQFKGPPLFPGYWNMPEKPAEAYPPDGWYRSGDVGHLDEGGRLILSGRKKDIIVLPNGFNVYPEGIET